MAFLVSFSVFAHCCVYREQIAEKRPPTATRTEEAESLIAEVRDSYRLGRTQDVITRTTLEKISGRDPDTFVALLITRGMAQFDLGDATASLATLAEAIEHSKQLELALQFTAAFAHFVRDTDFRAPEEVLPALAHLRQISARAGDSESLAGLHLAVARMEGLQGHCIDAHRHLEIARRFTSHGADDAVRCSVDLVEASLESIAGNLTRSRALAESCFERAEAAGF